MLTLTTNALKDIVTQSKQMQCPVLQVLNLKLVAQKDRSAADRYRLMLSDGTHHYTSVLLGTNLNHLIQTGTLDANAVVKVENYQISSVPPDRMVLIILGLQVVTPGSQVGQRIGNPSPLTVGAQPSTVVTSDKPMTDVSNVAPAAIPSTVTRPAPPSVPSKTSNYNGASVLNVEPLSQRKIFPIMAITPYQNKWTLRGRCISKTPLKTYSNTRGEGSLFSFVLADDSGEIRVTAFKEACDKFYNMLEQNKVYYVAKGSLKPANKKFSQVKNDYEMTLNSDSLVEPCLEDCADIPSISYSLTPIDEIANCTDGSFIDVMGICREAGDISTVTARQSQRQIVKRDIRLVDSSGHIIRATLWGEEAEKFDPSNSPVVLMRGAKVSSFDGRSVSSTMSGQVLVNPDTPEAFQLRGWYDSQGSSAEFRTLQAAGAGSSGNFTNIVTLDSMPKPQGDRSTFVTVKAVFSLLKSDRCLYEACPNKDCNKKMVPLGGQMFRCEKCQTEQNNFKWNLMLRGTVADATEGNVWVTMFGESAERLLGCSAQQLGELNEQNQFEFEQVFQRALFSEWMMRLGCRQEMYNDESRVKVTLHSLDAINYADQAVKLHKQMIEMGLCD